MVHSDVYVVSGINVKSGGWPEWISTLIGEINSSILEMSVMCLMKKKINQLWSTNI